MLISCTELHIICSSNDAVAVSKQLILLGAKAVAFKKTEESPIYESDPDKMSRWQKPIVIGLFEEKQISASLFESFQHFGKVTQHSLENKEWIRLSLSQFQPLSFGKKLWICPTWIASPDPHTINVILDPGTSFGTGKHPTTQLCLEWLVNHLSKEKIVIDYGCGSGILGMTAFKLGADKIYCVDIDEQALMMTRSNANLNKIPETNLLTFLPKQMPIIQADLLIANILVTPNIMLAPHFTKLIKQGGKILLSGILENQVDEIKKAYQPHFIFQPSTVQEGWACLEGMLV